MTRERTNASFCKPFNDLIPSQFSMDGLKTELCEYGPNGFRWGAEEKLKDRIDVFLEMRLADGRNRDSSKAVPCLCIVGSPSRLELLPRSCNRFRLEKACLKLCEVACVSSTLRKFFQFWGRMLRSERAVEILFRREQDTEAIEHFSQCGDCPVAAVRQSAFDLMSLLTNVRPTTEFDRVFARWLDADPLKAARDEVDDAADNPP